MVSYWHKHPRGFANECAFVRAANQTEADALEDLEYDRITRKELEEHIAWMNEENEAWGSGRAIGAYRLSDAQPAADLLARLAKIEQDRAEERDYWDELGRQEHALG